MLIITSFPYCVFHLFGHLIRMKWKYVREAVGAHREECGGGGGEGYTDGTAADGIEGREKWEWANRVEEKQVNGDGEPGVDI